MTHDPHTRSSLVVNDVALYYEVHGHSHDIPLIVIHGGPGFDHAYLKVSEAWSAIAAQRPVIFYDQRGCGRSPRLMAGQSCTLNDQIADLLALQLHLGFEQADLLGHSWGGFLAMAFAVRHPARVRRLILVDSVPPRIGDNISLFAEVFPDAMARRSVLAGAVEAGDEAARRASLREYFAMLCYSPHKREALPSAMDSFAYNPEIHRTLWADAASVELRPELAHLHAPTLVITGRFDMDVAPIIAYDLHRSIVASRLEVFEESGHLPFFEEPARFVSVVEGFLTDRA